jgi:hypothetical protein
VEAETKDHLNWELLAVASKALKGAEAKALKDASEQVAGGRAPVPFDRLVPRAVDRLARSAGRSPAARGGEGSQDRDRGGSS